jgi:hypothetical protein
MELCVNDKSTANPSADDIARAIDAAPHPEDWYLVLESDDGFYVEAAARPDGTYEVTASDQQRDLQANAPLDANRLKEILSRFLAGDAGWHDMGFSPVTDSKAKDGPGAAVARSGSAPPTWALAIVIGTIAIVVIAALLPRRFFGSLGDSDSFFIGLIAAPMGVLFIVAVLVKMLDVRRASTWSTAAGRIVRSDTEARRHRFAGEATTVTTVPLVEYEFSVGGRAWQGSRISIGEDSGGANTEATLRRYPVGAAVSVHYDPANPRNCVLERDIPEGVGKGLAILVAFGVAAAVGLYYLATSGPRLLSGYLPDGDSAPVVIVAACFGLLVLLFFIASFRLSRKAADWPMVRGTVSSSGSERVEKRESGRTQIYYVPVVEYRYRVSDVDYVSRQIKVGVALSASQAYATKVAARYPQGSGVDVHYDPANPSNAALENPRGFYWVLLVVALGCFAIAAHAGGFI